jgi:solute carrier family 25 protein 39/40
MSALTANRGRADGQIATAFENNALAASEGQRHDRFADDLALYGPPTDSAPGRDHNGDIDISAGQKMLSAMSGSLLTSLIGM